MSLHKLHCDYEFHSAFPLYPASASVRIYNRLQDWKNAAESGIISAKEDTNSSRGANPLLLLRRVIAPIFILLLMAASVNGQQRSGISDNPQQMIGSDQMDCAYLRNALRANQERVKRLQNAADATSPLNGSSSNGDLKPPAADLTYELKVLDHDNAEVEKCVAWNRRPMQV